MPDTKREPFALSAHHVEGQGLHTGVPSRVVFARSRGPVLFRGFGEGGRSEYRRDELEVVDTTRSTTIAPRSTARRDPPPPARLSTVEHLFAAFGGLSIHDGVVVDVQSSAGTAVTEVPLVDGGASAFVAQLRALGARPSAPSLHVVASVSIDVGTSRYELAPSDGTRLEVEIDFGDARLARGAAWSGDAEDFSARIAPARTFGFAREVPELLARGLASHVAPESVVVVGDEGIFSAGPLFTADEPARHKLLDLVGDLWLYGGPPRGVVRAFRPGHAATHEVVERALASGALVQVTRV